MVIVICTIFRPRITLPAVAVSAYPRTIEFLPRTLSRNQHVRAHCLAACPPR